MFILKFFASLFLLFFAIAFIIIIIGLLITRSFLSDVNESLSKKFNGDDISNKTKNNTSDIPNAIECSKCGTFYAEMPKDKKCSCGAYL